MAILRIIRSSEWANMKRDISIYINGQKLGTISNGQTKDFHINGGQYILYAQIDRATSNSVTIYIDEHGIKVFKLKGFKYANRFLALTLVLFILGLILSTAFDINVLIWIAAPILLLNVLYYTTIRRGRYLNLEELNS
jgi:hypothetical protein